MIQIAGTFEKRNPEPSRDISSLEARGESPMCRKLHAVPAKDPITLNVGILIHPSGNIDGMRFNLE